MEYPVLFLNLKLFMNRNRKGEVIRTEESAFLPMELDQTADKRYYNLRTTSFHFLYE